MVAIATLEGPETRGAGTGFGFSPAPRDSYTMVLHGSCRCETGLNGVPRTIYEVDAIELHGLNFKKIFKIKGPKLRLKMNFGKMFKIRPGRFKVKFKLGDIGRKIGRQFDKLTNSAGLSRFASRNLNLGKFATNFTKPVRGILEAGLQATTGLIDKFLPGAGGVLNEAGSDALDQGEDFVQQQAQAVGQEADAAVQDAISSADAMLQQLLEPPPPAQPPVFEDVSQIIPNLSPVMPTPSNPTPPPAPPAPQVVGQSGMDNATLMMIGGGAILLFVFMNQSGSRRGRR